MGTSAAELVWDRFGIDPRDGRRMVTMLRQLPQRAKDYLRHELGVQPNGNAIDLLDSACECVPTAIGVRLALYGIPGWDIAEVPDGFVPGPFRFPTATHATNATETVLSGDGGSWSTANAATVGDPNLSNFMPGSAEFQVAITGYEAWVAEDGDVDNPAGLSLLNLGLNWQHNRNGIQPYTALMLGHVTRAADVRVRTFADVAVGAAAVYAGIDHFRPARLPVPRPIDMENDRWELNAPASTSIAPGVTWVFHGAAFDPKKFAMSDRASLRAKAAWLVRGATVLPPLIMNRALNALGVIDGR